MTNCNVSIHGCVPCVTVPGTSSFNSASSSTCASNAGIKGSSVFEIDGICGGLLTLFFVSGILHIKALMIKYIIADNANDSHKLMAIVHASSAGAVIREIESAKPRKKNSLALEVISQPQIIKVMTPAFENDL